MESQRQKAKSNRGTGLAEHATTAAFTTSRAMTSHLRKRYRERYLGRSRHARVFFAFDLALLGLAVLLVGANLYLFTVIPAPLEGYRLDLATPAIRSAAPVALEARVSASGDEPRRDVRLEWAFPPGTEILQAEPPLAPGGAYLGTLAPGETRSSRVVVRLFQPVGDVGFGFRLRDADGEITGHATRRLAESGLRFEPLIPVASAVRGAFIPYRLRNDTALPLEGITVTAVRPSTVNDLVEVRVARLEPYEERVFAVRPSAMTAISLAAEMRGVRLVAREESYALLASDPAGVRLELEPAGGRELVFRAITDRAASLAVWHPGLSDEGHLRVLDIAPGERDLRLDVNPVTRETAWYVTPYVVRSDGYALGFSAVGSITTPFGIHASARYFAASGDQIGIGPLPPRVGEATRVWIGLRIEPTTSELTDVRVAARLAPGIRVTGRSALPDGGSFSQTDEALRWTLSFLPADEDGAQAFFEVEVTPVASDRGRVPLLIESVRAEALDGRTGRRRTADFGAVDMNLAEDERGKNLGKVE
ncbi:hypothetical protein EDM68_00375 [Candidatus Uhrbacteria bacterium]|nr:MAG: hypothetical protein EDM68_00375 [Candidatus Uhrbacteria bacterium]